MSSRAWAPTARRWALVSILGWGAGCGTAPAPCGPTSGVVASVSDGDTFTLESGEKVRLLMVDTPESTSTKECYGEESFQFTRQLMVGRAVTLSYGPQCTDRFDRLLAFVQIDQRDVSSLLVERGYACVLHIPPNGDEQVDTFHALEEAARTEKRGLWGVCSKRPC